MTQHDYLAISQLLNDNLLDEARELLDISLKKDPSNSQLLVLTKKYSQLSGNLQYAAAVFKNAIALNEMCIDANLYLSQTLLQLNKPQETIKYCSLLLCINSNNIDAHITIGKAYLHIDQLDSALRHLQRAEKAQPEDAATQQLLGIILRKKRDFLGAYKHLQKALKLQPDNATLYNITGLTLHNLGKANKAVDCFEAGLKLFPSDVNILTNCGFALRNMGNFTKAEKFFRNAIKYDVKCCAAYSGLANIKKYKTDDSQDIIAMQDLLADKRLSNNNISMLNFALGKAYDDCKKYDAAFEHYTIANRLNSTQNPYDAKGETIWHRELIKQFNADYFITQPQLPITQQKRVIFIVGFYRSGTTMLEQILLSHSKVTGKGETPFLTQALAMTAQLNRENLPYPQGIKNLKQTELKKIADEYRKNIEADIDTNVELIIDKQLINYQHLGIVSQLFPDAMIIHCKRHPIDTCLSVFFHSFDKNITFAHELKNIGHYYLHYKKTMEHWRKVLPTPIYESSYESLVAQPDNKIPALFDFLGLEWESAALKFYKQKEKAVQTASAWQVRQPIYKKSVARWHNYAQQLEDLRKQLGVDN
ncbi:MAG: sulfotransferase [Magnetococcales bacterium]|nr:sulfotransferase [Magnetococcales bacterium]